MAKIVSQVITITVSKAVKENDDEVFKPINKELSDSLECVVSELVGNGCVVEVAINE